MLENFTCYISSDNALLLPLVLIGFLPVLSVCAIVSIWSREKSCLGSVLILVSAPTASSLVFREFLYKILLKSLRISWSFEKMPSFYFKNSPAAPIDTDEAKVFFSGTWNNNKATGTVNLLAWNVWMKKIQDSSILVEFPRDFHSTIRGSCFLPSVGRQSSVSIQQEPF